MKKIIVVLVLLFAMSTVTVFAQSIEGKWLDSNWDAVWEISASLSATGVNMNVRILDSKNGNLIYNFVNNTQNRSLTMDGINPVLTFSCADTGRSYRFVSNLPGTNLTMIITRSNQPDYTVNMPKQ